MFMSIESILFLNTVNDLLEQMKSVDWCDLNSMTLNRINAKLCT